MKFQDQHGPLDGLGVFGADGALIRLVSDAEAWAVRDELDADHPGCEVLAVCPRHSDTSAVECLICWPYD